MQDEINPLNGRPVGQGFNEKVNSKSIDAEEPEAPIEINPLTNQKVGSVNEGDRFLNKETFGTFKTQSFADEIGSIEEEYAPYDVKIKRGRDIGEARAQNQGTGEKWANASTKLVTTAGTTFLDGTVGTVWGAVETAMGNERGLIDNEFSNKMLDIQEYMEEAFPNYYTHKESSAPWYKRLNTANFWADTIFKNLGFAIGAMGAGMLTGGISAEISGSKAIAKRVAKSVAKKLGKQYAKNPKLAIQALKSGKYSHLAGADDLLKELGKDAKILPWTNLTDELVGSSLGSMGEARIEALSAEREFYDKLIRGGMKDDEAQLRATEHANTVFAMNQVLLTAGNYAQFRNVFGGGYKPNANALGKIKGGIGELTANKASVGEIVSRGLKSPLIEGFEEMNQYFSQKFSEDFNTRQHDPKATSTMNNLISAAMTGLADSYGSAEGWENFAAGFITGGLGIPNVAKIAKGKLPTFEGNMFMEMREAVKENNKIDKHIEELIAVTNTPEFESYYLSTVRDLSLQADKDGKLAEQDQFSYKNLEHEQLLNHALLFSKLGKLNEFKEGLREMKNATAEDIQKAVQMKDDKGEVISDPLLGKDADDIKAMHEKRIDDMLETIDKMEEISDQIDIKSGGRISQEGKDALIHQAVVIEDVEKRVKSLTESINKDIGRFSKIDMDHFDKTGGIKLVPSEESQDITDFITIVESNPKLATEFADKFMRALYVQGERDSNMKRKLENGLADDIKDLGRLYSRRNNFIDMYVEAFSDMEASDADVKFRSKELQDKMRSLSLTYQNVNLAEDDKSFFAKNTELVWEKDEETGTVSQGLNSKAFKIKDKKGHVKVGHGHKSGTDYRDNKLDPQEDAEFEIVGILNSKGNEGNIALRDQYGNKAYYNKEGVLSYLGEKLDQFELEEVRGFKENLISKKVRAKYKALKDFADNSGQLRVDALNELQVVHQSLVEKRKELQESINLVNNTATGKPRQRQSALSRAAAEAVDDINGAILKLEEIKRSLERNVTEYQILEKKVRAEAEQALEQAREEAELANKYSELKDGALKTWDIQKDLAGVEPEEMVEVIEETKSIIEGINEHLDELYRMRNHFMNIASEATGKRAIDLTDDEIREAVAEDGTLEQIIELERLLGEYEETLDKYSDMKARTEFVSNHYNAVATNAHNEYLRLLGVNFSKGISTPEKPDSVESTIHSKEDTGDPLPVFTENGDDFLRTAGGDERNLSDPNVKRWFDWLQSEESDNTKKEIRFETYSLKTLPDELKGKVIFPTDPKLSKDAVVLVPIDKDGKVIEFNKGIPFAFLPRPTALKVSGNERFAYDPAIKKVAKEMMEEDKELTEVEAVEKATKEVRGKRFRAAQEEYRKYKRTILKKKKGDEPEVLFVHRKEPGARADSELSEPLGTIFGAKHGIDESDVVIKIADSNVINYNGRGYNVREGHVYVMHKGALVPAREKRLSETGDVDRIVRLFEYGLEQLDKDNVGEFDRIIGYLESIVYYSANESSDFRLYIKDADKSKKTPLRIHFGEQALSLDDMKNSLELLNDFKEFLGNKYHNIDKSQLSQKTSTYQKIDVKDGKTFTEKDYDNYQTYLLNDDGKGKFQVKLAPLSERQFLNRAFKLGTKQLVSKKKTATAKKASAILKNKKGPVNLEDIDVNDDAQMERFYESVAAREPVDGNIPATKEELAALLKFADKKTEAATFGTNEWIEWGGLWNSINNMIDGKSIESSTIHFEEVDSVPSAPKAKAPKKKKGGKSPEQTILDKIKPIVAAFKNTKVGATTEDKFKILEGDIEFLISSYGITEEDVNDFMKTQGSTLIKDVWRGDKANFFKLLEIRNGGAATTSTPGSTSSSISIEDVRDVTPTLTEDEYNQLIDTANANDTMSVLQDQVDNGVPRSFERLMKKISKTKTKSKSGKGKKVFKKRNMLSRTLVGKRKPPSPEEIQFFMEKFEKHGITAEKIKGLIDGKSWGQIKKNLDVLISDEAIEGVYYHEAFHVISQAFMTDEQRTEMYNDIRSKKGSVEVYDENENIVRKKFSELTDNQAEELLAEEFRDFMLIGPKGYKFGKTSKVKKGFFESIWEFITDLFGSRSEDGARKDTPQVFKDIANDTKFSKPLVSNIASDFNMLAIKSEGLEATIPEKTVRALMDDINSNFFDHLFGSNISEELTLSDKYGNLSDVYDAVKEFYEEQLEDAYNDEGEYVNAEAFLETIIENFPLFKEKHMKMLKQFRIDTDKVILNENSRDGKTRGDNGINAANTISTQDYVPEGVRLLLLGLPSTKVIKDSKGDLVIVPVDGKMNPALKMAESYTETVNILHNNLSGLESLYQIKEKLMELGQTNPSFEILAARLGIDEIEPGDGYVADNQFLWKLQNDFATHFAKNKNNVLIVYVTEDSLNFMDAVSETISKNVVDGWKSNVKIGNYKHIATEEKLFNKGSDGQYTADKESMVDLYRLYFREERTDSEGKTYWAEKNSTEEDVKEFLGYFGVHFPDTFVSGAAKTEIMDASRDFIKWMMDPKMGVPSIKGDTISFEEVFNKSRIKNNKELNILSQAIAENQFEYIELQYMNQSGQREYAVTLNTHISNTVNRLNNKNTPNHLKDYDKKTGKGNIVAGYSRWKGQDISVNLMRGMKSVTGTGDDVSKLKPTDFEAMSVNAILSGLAPYLRSSDRKLEYIFSNPAHKSNVSKNDVISGLRNMLEATLVQNGLSILDKDGIYEKLSVFDQNNLGFFNDFKVIGERNTDGNSLIVEEMKKELALRGTPSKANLPNVLSEVVNKALENVGLSDDVLNKILLEYFDESVNRVKEKLLDSEVIIASEKGKTFNPIGIDPNLLNGNSATGVSNKNLLDDKGNISQASFNKIAESVAFNYTMSGFEQTILFTGDIRHYYSGSKGWTNFHKRTTGAASTKTNSRTDEWFNTGADIWYPRLDEKQGDTRNDVNEIVVSDIIRNDQSGYDELNVGDGQSEMTIDEYRETYLRNKPWEQGLQKTWIYEQQMFIIRASKLGIKGYVGKDGVAKFKRLFREHLSDQALAMMDITNDVPGVPYYNKVQFELEPVLTPFPSIKTQGFGSLRDSKGNDGNSYKPNFTKHSSAPIMPSMISDKQIIRLAKLIDSKVGLVTFESGKKAEAGKKTDYNLETFIPKDHVQMLSYEDFGIQQEIDPSGKEKTTLSKQKERLLFYDYKNKKLAKEHHKVVGKMIRAARKKLFRELGLEDKNKNGNYRFISKEGKAKFARKLIDSFERREMALNIIEGLEEAMKDPETVFDTLISKKQIENTLHSMIRKDLVQVKVKGDMLVQQSSALIDLGLDSKGEQIKLGWYTKIADNKKVVAAEVVIALPRAIASSDWFQTLEYKGLIGLKALNLMIKDRSPLLPTEVYEFASNRIPGSNLNNTEYFTIKKFLPHHYGPNIVVPEEMVAKSGSDFDIDKLTTYFYNLKFLRETGEKGEITHSIARKTRYKTKNEYWEENLDSILKEYDEEFYDKKVAPLDKIWDDSIAKLKLEEHDYFWGQFEAGNITHGEFMNKRALYIVNRDAMINSKKESINKAVAKLPEDIKVKWKRENKLEDLNDADQSFYENELIDIHKKALLDPIRYDHLVMEQNADSLKRQSKIVGKASDIKSYFLLEWGYNMDIARDYWAGQMGVGQAALQITSHAATQLAPVRVEDSVFEIFFNNQNEEKDSPYYLGHTTTKNGQKISTLFGEFLQAFVDIANDPFIFKINAGSAIFPVYSLLIRMSNKENGTLDIGDAVNFLAQPIIREFVKSRNVKESAIHSVRGSKTTKETKKQTVERLLNGFSSSLSENNTHENVAEYLVEKEGSTVKNILKNRILKKNSEKQSLDSSLMKEINKATKDMSWKEAQSYINKNPAMQEMQAQILDDFLTYQQYARELGSLNKITRPDSDFTNSRTKLKFQRKTSERVKAKGFFLKADIDNMLENTYLAPFEEVQKDGLGFFKDFFVTSRNSNVSEAIDDVIDEVSEPKKKKGDQDLEKIGTLLEDDIMTFLFQTLRTENGRVSSRLKELILSNEKSVARRLVDMQGRKGLKDNPLIEEMIPIINEYVKSRGKGTGLDNIRLYSKSTKATDLNSLKDAFIELYDHKDPEVRAFAEDLSIFSIVQSGFSSSFMDFKNIVPEVRFRSKVKEILSDAINDIEIDMQHFKDQFYRNNWNESTLVPSIKKFSVMSLDPNTGRMELERGKLGFDHEYVSIVDSPITDEAGNKIYNKKLYRRTSVPSLSDTNVTFQEISKLGDGFRFKEYYPGQGYNSAIEDNNFESREAKKKTTFKKGKFKGKKWKGKKRGQPSIEIESLKGLPTSPELKASLKNFMDRIGVDLNQVEKIMVGKGLNANGLARLSDMVIDIVNSKEGWEALPEEAAHFFVSMLPEGHALRKSLIRGAHKLKIYDEVKAEYAEYYKNEPNAEDLIRLEVAGKIIGEHMKAIDSGVEFTPEVKAERWYEQIINWISKLFGKAKSNDYFVAAKKVLDQDVADLESEPNILTSMPSMSRQDYLSESQWSRNKYESKYTYSKGKSKAKVKKEVAAKNISEVKAVEEKRESYVEIDTMDEAKRQVFNDFERFYPNYAYLNNEERLEFVEMLSRGELEMYCY
jgi:hypothetical protein